MAEEGKAGWFIYGFVARGTVVLAEYTKYTGSFPAIAAQCLEKLPSSTKLSTYSCDGHTFVFLVYNGYAYCVVTKDSVVRNISIAFLERLKADFTKRYGDDKADTATAKSLNKEFGPIIKKHMQYIIDHAEEVDKLLRVNVQISEVKNIMLENINKTMDRGVKLNDLEIKTTELRNEAQLFKKQGTRMHKKMWLQNMKIKLVVLAILLLIVILIWVSVCQGFICTK